MVIPSLAMLAFSLCPAQAGPAAGAGVKTYDADGRTPIQELYSAMDGLAKKGGWTMETVYQDEGLPIRVLRTKRKGPAVWLLAGIHGEEPAPPDAVARSIDKLDALAAKKIPVVLFPLCNPVGYSKGWRYPDAKGRGGDKPGHSVGDSDHLLPGKDGKPRLPRAGSAQAAALTGEVLELAREYPPVLSVDLHEDDSIEKGYIYSQGAKGAADPAAKAVLKRMEELRYPIKRSGKTDFDEPIVGGVVADVKDGSIDELISADKVLVDGREVPGPGGKSVIVVETSSMKMALQERVRLHRSIIGMLAELFRKAGK